MRNAFILAVLVSVVCAVACPPQVLAQIEASGLRVESRHATYDLRPFDPEGEFGVFVLKAAGRGGRPGARHETR